MHEPLETGNYYHIYNRGNNRENLFVEYINYNFFLSKYSKYCYPVFDTFAYCLLKNHFHLFVRVRTQKETNNLLKAEGFDTKTIKQLTKKVWSSKLVSQQLGHALNSYTQAFNKKYGRSGSLFERPFKRRKVNADSYFCNLICYIHRNPQHHRIVEDYREYPHSSYRMYLSEKQSKINVKETLRQFDGISNFLIAHQEMPWQTGDLE